MEQVIYLLVVYLKEGTKYIELRRIKLNFLKKKMSAPWNDSSGVLVVRDVCEGGTLFFYF